MQEVRLAKVGDWVRFRRDGVLVIGVVEYVRPCEHFWEGRATYETDIGGTNDKGVLEIRGPRELSPFTVQAGA